MALQLSQIISAARNWNPRFEHRFVPSKAVADYLTGRQHELIAEALKRNKEYLTQRATIVFDVSDANAVGTVGAGTAGGLPATAVDEVFSVVESPVGNALVVDMDAAGATILVAERPVTGATATTLATVGTAWTVNGYAGRHVRITAGTGAGQQRAIVANGASDLSLAATQPWDTIPDATSLFEIVDPVLTVDRSQSAVTALPSELTQRSYLVRLDAGGQPYIDFTKPLLAAYSVGIDLPPHHYVLGGTVRYKSSPFLDPLHLQGYEHRLRPVGWPAAWIENGQLFLCGAAQDWSDVASIELRYTPITPAFTATTDYFLLPDSAYQTLVTSTAVFMALRVNALPEIAGVDVEPLVAQASVAEARWLDQVGLQKRARVGVMREGW